MDNAIHTGIYTTAGLAAIEALLDGYARQHFRMMSSCFVDDIHSLVTDAIPHCMAKFDASMEVVIVPESRDRSWLSCVDAFAKIIRSPHEALLTIGDVLKKSAAQTIVHPGSNKPVEDLHAPCMRKCIVIGRHVTHMLDLKHAALACDVMMGDVSGWNPKEVDAFIGEPLNPIEHEVVQTAMHELGLAAEKFNIDICTVGKGDSAFSPEEAKLVHAMKMKFLNVKDEMFNIVMAHMQKNCAGNCKVTNTMVHKMICNNSFDQAMYTIEWELP